MPNSYFSIVIIIKGRRQQLCNVLRSIQDSTIAPHDVQVIAVDNPADIQIPSGMDNVFITHLNSDQSLPLAEARNKGCSLAQTDVVIFLDVDCMVSPTLCASLKNSLRSGVVVSAYPRYLQFVPTNETYNDLVGASIVHPNREAIISDAPVNHLKFWSLVFAITRQDFESYNGFDEQYVGYGAEDTDFAMSFNSKNIQLVFVRDYVLHQYHDKYDPPLNYFDDILQNATTFKQKWGFYPMERWLHKFSELGLIKPFTEHDELVVLRQPTLDEKERCRSTQPY